MGQERRQYFRFATNWKGRVLLSDRSLYQVQVKDISKGGVAINFPHILPLHEPVNIEFFASITKESVRIRAKTIVTHHTVLTNGNGVRLGLKFSEMDKQTAHDFSNILQELADRTD